MLVAEARPRNPIFEVLGIRNFAMLWAGQGTSLLGDYFNLIALPWLVLQLTGDGLALGTVLALEGIPRALFMLLGGAVTDRFSSRGIMLLSDSARLVLCVVLVVLVVTGTVNLWALYAVALCFGFVSAFFQPAAGAMLPALVPESHRQPANAVYQGTTQLLGFVGPMLAGAVIGVFGSASVGTGAAGTLGIAVAFGADAVSFVISIMTLWAMQVPAAVRSNANAHPESVLESIRAGIAFVWNNSVMRMLFIVMSAANLLFVGPIDVGMPMLAKQRLPEGIAGFGILLAGYAGGNLLGTVLSGKIKPTRGFRAFTVVLLFAFGLAIMPFGWIPSAWVGFTIFFVIGIGNGYFGIVLFTLLQKRTPPEMMGRVMSLFVLAGVGLVPVSQAVSGFVVNTSLDALFIGAGALMLVVAVWTTLSPTLDVMVAQVQALAAGREETGL